LSQKQQVPTQEEFLWASSAWSLQWTQEPNIMCRYCKKKGHMQKECRSRQQDKAPMVDARGKPYENRVNNVAEDNKPEQEYEDAQVGAVTNLSPYHHLNW
jgi:hypothetical protein